MQTTGNNRNNIDKFYTKPIIAKRCIDKFIEVIAPDENDLYIEPSAGNGAFSNQMQMNNMQFYDILPDAENIIQQDFLELHIESSSMLNPYKIHIIGNPPFGKLSSTARKFIKKCCSFADSISFILPKSFKKDSFKRAFSLNYHLIYEEDLESCAFLLGNSDIEYDVPCIFQIWKKMQDMRESPSIIESNYFAFIKKTENPDLAIRRVGVYAGKIYTDINKSTQSHYFIKLNSGINPEEFVYRYEQNIIFEHQNTVGPRSISKQELIKKTNDEIILPNIFSEVSENL